MRIKNTGGALLLSAAVLTIGCGTTNIKLEKVKLSAIKKIALVQTIFEIPTMSGDRTNFFVGMRGEKFDKGFAAIKADFLAAESQSATEIRDIIAAKIAADFAVPTISGAKLIKSKEYQALEKKGISVIPLEPYSREGLSIIVPAGEKNFLKPSKKDAWKGQEESITTMMEDDEVAKLMGQLCENLQVDAVAVSINNVGVYIASNKSGAVLRNSVFVFDKNGARLLAAHAYADQDLNDGDDITAFRALLAKSNDNIDKLFKDIALERK